MEYRLDNQHRMECFVEPFEKQPPNQKKNAADEKKNEIGGQTNGQRMMMKLLAVQKDWIVWQKIGLNSHWKHEMKIGWMHLVYLC